MSDLRFIAANIYHLKKEYGNVIIIGTKTNTLNTKTGEKVFTLNEFTVKKAIPLPLNTRQFFARFREGRKEGYLEVGQQEFLIDLKDVPNGQSIPAVNGYIKYNNSYYDIVTVENYQYGVIVLAKAISGMPIPGA